MQVPTQPLLRPAPSVDEIVAMVNKQLQITKNLLVDARPTQVRLPQRCACDRERVDRVRLATRAARPSFRHRQLRRHPHQLLTRREQQPLQPARQLPAILNCPQPLIAVRRRPAEQLIAADYRDLLAEPTARLVDGDSGDRLLVYVQSDHDHVVRLLNRWGRPASGQTSIEAKATLLSGHARRSRTAAATQRWTVSPRATFGIESAAAARVCAAHRTPPRHRE